MIDRFIRYIGEYGFGDLGYGLMEHALTRVAPYNTRDKPFEIFIGFYS
jgi:hypothetical protein